MTKTQNITQTIHGTELGVITRDGYVYVYPSHPKGAIKNRLFTPKWVQDEFSKGNVIVDAIVEARLDERTGRHYPVVRGKAVADCVISDDFWLDDYRNIVRTTKWLSGKIKTTNWHFRSLPKEVMAEISADQRVRVNELIRNARLKEIFISRYHNGTIVRTPKGIPSLEKVTFVNFDKRTMMVNVERTYTTNGEAVGYRIVNGKIVKNQVDAPYSLICRSQEPIDAHFKVEYGKPYFKCFSDVSNFTYESNDGRGMRSESTDHLNLFRCVDVVVKDNEGNKVGSWVNEEFITGVSW